MTRDRYLQLIATRCRAVGAHGRAELVGWKTKAPVGALISLSPETSREIRAELVRASEDITREIESEGGARVPICVVPEGFHVAAIQRPPRAPRALPPRRWAKSQKT